MTEPKYTNVILPGILVFLAITAGGFALYYGLGASRSGTENPVTALQSGTLPRHPGEATKTAPSGRTPPSSPDRSTSTSGASSMTPSSLRNGEPTSAPLPQNAEQPDTLSAEESVWPPQSPPSFLPGEEKETTDPDAKEPDTLSAEESVPPAGVDPTLNPGPKSKIAVPPLAGKTPETKTADARPHPAGGGARLYGRGKPADETGSIARGDIPPGQEQGSVRTAPAGQDSVVGLAFVEDLAEFLVQNYWPAGTHPMAQGRGISTAGVRWVNHRYGGRLQGFKTTGGNTGVGRERILQYAYTPSMLKGLYRLYGDRFFEAFKADASVLERGPNRTPLTPAQKAEVSGIYSRLTGGIASTIEAYARTPDVAALVGAYNLAAQEAAQAYIEYAYSVESDDTAVQSVQAIVYHSALRKRDEAENALVSALRENGAGTSLDADTQIYIAQWLHRRGNGNAASFAALSQILKDGAARFSALEKSFGARPK